MKLSIEVVINCVRPKISVVYGYHQKGPPQAGRPGVFQED